MVNKNKAGMAPGEGSVVGAASVSIGAVVAATIGAACCTGPLLGPVIVLILGASGAATLAGLKPYTPYLFGLSLVMLTGSFWTIYRRSSACAVDAYGRSKHPARGPIRLLLWIAAAIWLASVSFTLFSLTRS